MSSGIEARIMAPPLKWPTTILPSAKKNLQKILVKNQTG
jgi:hypothetical protein